MFQTLSLHTKEQLDIIDITQDVQKFIKKSAVKNGLINIQSLHTTATVFLNENEPLLMKDFKTHIRKIAPDTEEYNHDNFDERTVNMCDDECANGHAHCKALHLPLSICLNIKEGELQLGSWQRIMFVELDRPRDRQIQMQIITEE